jgi:putative DNA primase/helicase
MSAHAGDGVRVIEQFREAIRAAGLTPPDTAIADGELRRFASNGQRGDDAGWYVLRSDPIPSGIFGCWRAGVRHTWRADIGRNMSAAETAELSRRAADHKRGREYDQAQRHSRARDLAKAIWTRATPASMDHPYLVNKRVKPYGVRQCRDELLIPVRDVGGELLSLQFIAPDGKKRFLPGGRVAGGHFIIGTARDALCITEGYATAATVHEVTGYAVAVAFNARNLLMAATALHIRHPNTRMIVCADDDHRTPR